MVSHMKRDCKVKYDLWIIEITQQFLSSLESLTVSHISEQNCSEEKAMCFGNVYDTWALIWWSWFIYLIREDMWLWWLHKMWTNWTCICVYQYKKHLNRLRDSYHNGQMAEGLHYLYNGKSYMASQHLYVKMATNHAHSFVLLWIYHQLLWIHTIHLLIFFRVPSWQ